MRYKAIALFLFTIVFVQTYSSAQECMHTNLSRKFNYEISVVKNKAHAKILLNVLTKQNKIIKKIYIDSAYVFNDAYNNCTSVRSYITGYNKNKDVFDYDFGDFIVADLNFDGRDDFAIKHDSGGNGGPDYDFYVQDNNGNFKLDHFLTDSVGSFPKYISVKHKTLTTQIHANARYEGKKTFKYNPINKKWRLVKWLDVEY